MSRNRQVHYGYREGWPSLGVVVPSGGIEGGDRSFSTIYARVDPALSSLGYKFYHATSLLPRPRFQLLCFGIPPRDRLPDSETEKLFAWFNDESRGVGDYFTSPYWAIVTLRGPDAVKFQDPVDGSRRDFDQGSARSGLTGLFEGLDSVEVASPVADDDPVSSVDDVEPPSPNAFGPDDVARFEWLYGEWLSGRPEPTDSGSVTKVSPVVGDGEETAVVDGGPVELEKIPGSRVFGILRPDDRESYERREIGPFEAAGLEFEDSSQRERLRSWLASSATAVGDHFISGMGWILTRLC